MAMTLPTPITITEAAARRVKEIMAQRTKPAIGLRIGVKARGCSGLTYTVEYAEEKKKFEDAVEDKGVTILIEPTATMFLLGSEMDYIEDTFESKFVFRNPNEKGRCGCGESFHV